MSDPHSTHDPLGDAAAAIRRGHDLAPLLRHRLTVLIPDTPFDRLLERVDRHLFEPRTLAALRSLLDVVEMAASREIYPLSNCVPVGCIDGEETFEEVTRWKRTPNGDELVGIGAELRALIRLVKRAGSAR